MAPKPLANKDELDSLRELQRQHKQIWTHINFACTDAAAAERHNRQHYEHGAKLSNGETDFRSHSLEQMKAENATQAEAGKGRLGIISNQAVGIAAKVHARYLSLAETILASETKAEQARCERFGVPFVPSHLLVELRSLVDWCHRFAPVQGERPSASPASMVPYITLD